MITKKSLGIFWYNPNSNGEGGHHEVEGMSFFSVWKKPASAPSVEEYLRMWKMVDVDLRRFQYEYSSYSILLFDVWIKKWPDSNNWNAILLDALKFFTENGAVMSWCGGEGCFDNRIINDGVYACYVPELGMLCNSSLDEEVQFLTSCQIAKVSEFFAVRGVDLTDFRVAQVQHSDQN